MDNDLLEKILAAIDGRRHYFETFQQAVVARFEKDPRLNGSPPILHSIKFRIKDRDHLR